MNLSGQDIAIIFGMTIAVVSMSFLFPALGMTGEEKVNNTDIPEFSVESNAFDFAGEFPKSPGTPTSGTLYLNDSKTPNPDGYTIISNNPTEDITSLSPTDKDVSMLIETDGGDRVYQDIVELQNVGETKQFSNNSWTIALTLENRSLSTLGTEWETAEVHFEIVEQPSQNDNDGFFGTITNAGGELAQIIGWVGSVLFWFVGTIVEFIVNIFLITVNITTFLVDYLVFLTTTYGAIVSGAPGWASIIVALPGVLLTLEFGKLAIIAVEVIWIG